MRSASACRSSRLSPRSRRRRRSCSAVSSSMPLGAARASSSARSATSSLVGRPAADEMRARRADAARRRSAPARARSRMPPSEGCATTPASASRSSRRPHPAPLPTPIPSRRATARRAPPARRAAGRAGRPRSACASRRSGESSNRPSSSRTRDERLVPVAGALHLEPNAVEEIARGARKELLEAFGRVGGVEPGGQRHDPHVEAALERELHPAQRRRLAGRVAVEAEVDALREARQLAQLALGERSPHRRDHGLDARLAQREHVGVPLHHDRAPFLRHRRRGPGGARTAARPCGRGRPRASSRTWPGAGRPRAASAPGSRARGRARRTSGKTSRPPK